MWGNRWEDGSHRVTGLILLMAAQRGEKQHSAAENVQLSVSSLCPQIRFRLLIQIHSDWDEKRLFFLLVRIAATPAQTRRIRSLIRHGNSPQPLVVLINSSFQADKFRPNNKCSAVVIAERMGGKKKSSRLCMQLRNNPEY